MTPEERKAHFKAEERNVFGHDVKHDKKGNPIEQGIGSPGHETLNHFRALALAEQQGREAPGTYDAAVADIWKRDPERARKIGLHQPKKAA